MKRFITLILTLLLTMSIIMPSAAMAAPKKNKIIYIVNVDANGLRVRSTPSGGNNVMTTLPKGTKLFYLGKSGSYYKVCSEYSFKTGYVYSGYCSYYGAAAYNSIFMCDGRTRLYSRPSTSASRVTTLKDEQFVIVRAVSGKWAYVYTISGQKGYVPVASLDSID